jgi:c-di-GMP-binding flagellar brake protein YcgR
MERIEKERRAFVRINKALDVSYKFFTEEKHINEKLLKKRYKGRTKNLSSNGLLLVGDVPEPDWMKELLNRRMSLALSIKIPRQKTPVKAIAKVAWLDVMVDDPKQIYEMGVYFQEITHQDKQHLVKFIIQNLI